MTYSTSYPQEGSGDGCAGVLILTAIVVVLFFGAALLMGPALVAEDTAMISILEVVLSEHALGHKEAPLVRDCLKKNGASEVWRSFNKETYYLLCQLPDGRWGFMAIVKEAIDQFWHEKTSFIKDDGSRSGLVNYLTKWGTKFKGPFPWQ
jgi:hypothetical protein